MVRNGRCIVVALVIGGASATSMHLAKLCRGQLCDSPASPILDYDEASETCICRSHPCWVDDDVEHACNSPDYPHLTFKYDKDRKLTCECSSIPHYSSLYISYDLCPGHYCEDDRFPVLDWDEDNGKCICRVHPCDDIEGMKHECTDPAFPILRYREEEPDYAGVAKPICECVAKIGSPPHEEL